MTVGSGKNAVSVDGGVATLLQAIGTAGRPGAFSSSATNPTDMGTGGILGGKAQLSPDTGNQSVVQDLNPQLSQSSSKDDSFNFRGNATTVDFVAGREQRPDRGGGGEVKKYHKYPNFTLRRK